MKSAKNQNLVTLFAKPYKTQLQLTNFLYIFFLFGFGIVTGIVLSSYLKTISFNLRITQFSLFATSSSTPPFSSSSTKRLPLIGLKEFFKVPDVKHDIEDEELLWRASTAPRIGEYPFAMVPKVAFMFLTKGSVLMAPLWEKFFKRHQGFVFNLRAFQSFL